MPLLTRPDGVTATPSGPVARRTPEGQRQLRRPGRVVGLDMARALAVFGMVGAHFGAVPADVGVSPSSWLGIVHGRSSILFAVLAGVSVALLTGRTAAPAGEDLVRARIRLLVRAAWAFGIGATLEALGTDIDVILGVYAILFLLVLPFLRWSPRRLLLAAAVLAVLTPPLALLLTVWAQATGLEESPFVLLMLNGPYPALIWWTFILVGMAVGRSDLSSPRLRARLLSAGATLAVLGYTTGWMTSGWWGQAASTQDWVDGEIDSRSWSLTWLTGAAPHSGTTCEIVGSAGVALVVIAVCLVVAERLPTTTFPLVSVGAMALTTYTSHVFAPAVLDWDVEGVATWMAFIGVIVVLATGWHLVVGQGPLEKLLSSSSHRAAALAVRHRASRPQPSS
ncbi:heparan-alpha-glucosaminide N-acetyltransferase domain-containing protein [Geodermatophilus sabuli]|uniref:Heparan-alpha-glucosaminide N-acetyltransferase catalytic domain-containing protein n=1 Tax=Geodermatophilus sabuli TaxID=1564158 RepID=A0A285EDG9_9ACTN|nr:heparan-alpha-glucosaminide N-acetyltransferase domain-containing protein [Geodermatophilus sabuli]MBB3085475.1 putative membrane protein YeiB [Geodermatophilus sabuli]SNX96101.1 Protein of unknown function [Geodermatophilus sabuli]